VLRALSEALFGDDLSLPEFPYRPDLCGIGLSDWCYTDGLAAKLSYLNTFYDRDPFVDITDPPEDLRGKLDFVISSDVFEHVPPPVERAFEGAFELLKPGGFLILTVPYLLAGDSIEWFPRLHDWKAVEEADGSTTVLNTTVDGNEEVFENVRLHAGPGLIVEMRIFSHADLIETVERAGFEVADDWRWRGREVDPAWTENHSFPIVARRPLLPVRATERS
jgi:SAM-dependent methyltransferase